MNFMSLFKSLEAINPEEVMHGYIRVLESMKRLEDACNRLERRLTEVELQAARLEEDA